MKAYVSDEEGKCVVKNYGDGLYMIKDRSRGQGRCLYYTRIVSAVNRGSEVERTENLAALLFYKKETQEAPGHVLETARARLKQARA